MESCTPKVCTDKQQVFPTAELLADDYFSAAPKVEDILGDIKLPSLPSGLPSIPNPLDMLGGGGGGGGGDGGGGGFEMPSIGLPSIPNPLDMLGGGDGGGGGGGGAGADTGIGAFFLRWRLTGSSHTSGRRISG